MATSFTPKDNPAFILHGKLDTSYGTVSAGGSLVWTMAVARYAR